MSIKVRPAQLSQLLAHTIANNLPVLITGAPGVGKSDLVTQAALAAGADIIISHPAVADPTDAKGLPWPSKDGDEATFLPFGELARALKAEKPTVWFLDDLGQATPAVQASFMQLLLARRVNGHVLPDCVTFVAATNRRTDRAGVTGILEPVKSRFATIVEFQPSLDDWCDWALNNGIPVELIAFLRFKPELLHDFSATADLTNSPSPRTWHSVAKLMKANLPSSLEFPAFAGAVGEGAATEFVAFLRVYRELPNIDAILVNPDSQEVPSQPSVLYAVAAALAQRANETNFSRVARYCERMMKDGFGEFAAMLVRDAQRITPTICNSPAFVTAMCGDLGKLISGTVA